MRELMAMLAGYGGLVNLYLGAMLAVLVWVTVGMTRPILLVLALLLVLAAFPASSLLNAEGGLGFDIYAKGSGYLLFSLYEITIFMAALCVVLRTLFDRHERAGAALTGRVLPQPPGNPYSLFYALVALMLVAHAVENSVSIDDRWYYAFSRSGVVYLVLQGLLVAALAGVIAAPAQLRLLVLSVGAVVAGRMVWGAFRYLVLEGDPANYYETDANQFRITFWDINDSLWAVMLAVGLTWLAATRDDWSGLRRTLLLGFAMFCLAIVALSARRTAQLGAFLALLSLFALLPRGRRWWVGVMFALVMPVAVYKLGTRTEGDTRNFVQKLMSNPQNQSYFNDPRRERFYELRVAWQDVKKNPWFGVGPEGRFNPPSHVGLEYHKGNYGFVHSGFGHVLLKTGVVGLALFLALFVVWARQLRRQWRDAPPHYRALLAASACGMAAELPNVAVGTPLIELRTMLVLGVVFALPLMVARAAHAERHPLPVRPLVWHSGRLFRRRQRAAWGRA